jgi:hypothetical protein
MTPAQPCKFRTFISSFSPYGDSAKTIFQRRLLTARFADHTHGALNDFRGIFGLLLHSSIYMDASRSQGI